MMDRSDLIRRLLDAVHYNSPTAELLIEATEALTLAPPTSYDPLAPSRSFDPTARLLAEPTMPTFTLIAQDNLAAGLVEQWAIQSKQSGNTPHEKTTDAYQIADQMRRWHRHKDPD